MEVVMKRKSFFSLLTKKSEVEKVNKISSLAGGKINSPYTIKEIRTEDQEMKDFLFSLGCYEGEEVTIISRLADNLVLSIKDARYSINIELAKVIIV